MVKSSATPIHASAIPTLTLQIPFQLLGTHAIPSVLYSQAEHSTEPLHIICEAFRKCCPEVPVVVWDPSPQPVLDISKSNGGDDDHDDADQRLANQVELERKIKEWEGKEEAEWEVVRETSWVLRRGDGGNFAEGLGVLGCKDGDGQLTVDEKRLLGTEVWSFPAMLQRFEVVTSNVGVEKLEQEVSRLEGVMREYFGYDGGIDGWGQEKARDRSKLARVVCSERCHLKVAICPPMTRGTARSRISNAGTVASPLDRFHGQEDVEQKNRVALDGWSLHEVAKMLLLLVAFERELLLLTTSSAVLRFWPLSRFLEHISIKNLRQEKRKLWRALRSSKDKVPVEKSWESEEKTWRQVLHDDREEEAGMAFEDDRPGAWTTMAKLAGGTRGNQGIEELLREMSTFEQKGGRVTVGFNTDAKSTRIPTVNSILFQDHRSTLSTNHLLAYVNLVSCLVHHATLNSYASIILEVHSLREIAEDLDEEVEESLERLLVLLDVKPLTKTTFLGRITKSTEEDEEKEVVVTTSEKDFMYPAFPWEKEEPLTRLENAIHETLAKDQAYMPTFIQRYTEAGGFCITSQAKMNELLIAEERSRRLAHVALANGQKKKDRETAVWIDGPGSMGIGADRKFKGPVYEVGPMGLVVGSSISTASGASPIPVTPISPRKLSRKGSRFSRGRGGMGEVLHSPVPRHQINIDKLQEDVDEARGAGETPREEREGLGKVYSESKIQSLAERFTSSATSRERDWERIYEGRKRSGVSSPLKRE